MTFLNTCYFSFSSPSQISPKEEPKRVAVTSRALLLKKRFEILSFFQLISLLPIVMETRAKAISNEQTIKVASIIVTILLASIETGVCLLLLKVPLAVDPVNHEKCTTSLVQNAKRNCKSRDIGVNINRQFGSQIMYFVGCRGMLVLLQWCRVMLVLWNDSFYFAMPVFLTATIMVTRWFLMTTEFFAIIVVSFKTSDEDWFGILIRFIFILCTYNLVVTKCKFESNLLNSFFMKFQLTLPVRSF